ncbi:MAG: translation initiation factor IF-2 [Patescibacteria group bacterium]
MAQNQGKNLITRPPIVVVMGHVDHGKTTLLDNIKKTNLAAKEAGGITQSIGAYEIKHEGKKITFIDTPGHEAFSKMRARGAKIADLAILVVAADDSVQPQTKESINILNETKTPFIVAINKIDKPNADIEKTKNDLMQNNVFLEGAGGNVSWHKISAKSGEGINELLDLILLAAELENLTYDPDVSAKGIIIEAKLDSRRGITASAIIENGILKVGNHIATKTACGKIKSLGNFIGEPVSQLEPSAPALILGFETLPEIGEEFMTGEIALSKTETKKEITIRPKAEIKTKETRPQLNLIIKADVSGSLEALSGIVKNLNQEKIKINVLEEQVGEITDGDVKSAGDNNSIIIGFNVKTTKAAENLARAREIKIVTSKIIYEIIQMIEKEMEAIEKPAPLAEIEILSIFSQKDKKQLVGGKVASGTLKKNISVKILRQNEEIGSGKITSLKSFKQEVNQILSPNEGGIMIESVTIIIVGDRLIVEAPKK